MFDAWNLESWNTICITSDGQNLKLFINHIEFENLFPAGPISSNLLVKDKSKNPILAHITDFNIWDEAKPNSFIKDWSQCSPQNQGTIIKWSDLNFDGFETEETDSLCKGHERTMNFSLYRTDHVCPRVGGKECEYNGCCIVDDFNVYRLHIEPKHQGIDTHYVLVNETTFIGYMFTNIIRNDKTEEFEMKAKNGQFLARFRKPETEFALGGNTLCKNESDSSCDKRSTSFHKVVPQPGNYNCGSKWIDSSKVCDRAEDCVGGGDELQDSKRARWSCFNRVTGSSEKDDIQIRLNIASFYE